MASTDVTKKSDVDTAFSKFLGDGKLNILVSNAALAGPMESVEDVDGDKFLDAVQQNLKGSLNIGEGIYSLCCDGCCCHRDQFCGCASQPHFAACGV